MLERRTFLAGTGAVLLAAPLAGEAQQAATVPRIGFLTMINLAGARHAPEAFRQGLRDLGYVEGRNVVIEYRDAEGKPERLPGSRGRAGPAQGGHHRSGGDAGSGGSQDRTETIPIVMISGSADPVGLGFIASLARPGGNVTGLTFSVGPEIAGKQLELLKEIVPKVRRVAILSNPTNPVQPLFISELNVAARSLGVQLQLLEVRGPNEFDGAFAAMATERVGALLVVADSMLVQHRRRLVDLAARIRLPAAYGVRANVEAGGLMSYGPSVSDLFRRGATYVDKILKGAKPGDLPVEQPTKFETGD